MKSSLIALTALLSASPALADTLVDNANGIQVGANGKLEHFTGLLVGDDGRVKRVLHGEKFKLPAGTIVVDVAGRTMLPGLIDAHGHVIDLGFAALRLDLTGTRSLADVQERLRTYAAAHPDLPWISGFGWNQESWADKRFPTAADLDAAVGNRPVTLERVDGHAVVANGAALRAAGITAASRSPAGGEIHDGLFVDNARGLIDKAVPKPSAAQIDEALAKAQAILLGYGVTGVGAMSVSTDDWAAFTRAGQGKRLNIRLMTYSLNAPLPAAPRPTGWLYGDHLRMVGVKLFADGALGSRGAWLKQPYADKPDTRGLQFHSGPELLLLASLATKAGFQVATHAIGDAANDQAITTYEVLHRQYPGDRRWRIEHFQIVDPADLKRLKAAGIIASMQPTHQTSDRLMAEARLGKARLRGAYAWRSIEKLGVPLAFGSDFPVESPNPFPGLSAAISRQDPSGNPPGGWRPEERVSFTTALSGFTRSAAYAGFSEKQIGSLDPGKWADFIIVDRDVTTVDPQALAATKVLETWVAGKKVFSADAPPAR